MLFHSDILRHLFKLSKWMSHHLSNQPLATVLMAGLCHLLRPECFLLRGASVEVCLKQRGLGNQEAGWGGAWVGGLGKT